MSEVKLTDKALADKLQFAYDRFVQTVDNGLDAKSDAWDDFADLCEAHLPQICEALSSATQGVGAREVSLTGVEGEFVAEMMLDAGVPLNGWRTFEPDFRQTEIKRLFARGWFEKRGDQKFREYRWTPLGRSALAPEIKEGRR